MKSANVFVTSEVTLILRAKLGNIRAWEQALMEMRNQGADAFGFKLLPCARIYDGRSYRPIYDEDDINEFIRCVREVCPSAASRQSPQSRVVDYDPSKHWKVQRLKLLGISATH